jgi:ParB family chromosome partitioning protein
MSRTEELRTQLGTTLTQNLGGDGVREAMPKLIRSSPDGSIPVATQVADPDEQRQRARGFWLIPTYRIEPDALQPRTEFEEEGLILLSKDIAKRGLLMPLRVRKGRGDMYTIIAGERRWRAAKIAQVKELPCQVIDQAMTEAAILEEQLIENIHREQLSEVEKAKGYQQLIVANGWSQSGLAQSLNLSDASVSRTLKLLDLAAPVREHVSAGRLSASTAYEIGRIGDSEKQTELAERAVAYGLSRDDVASEVQDQAGRRGHKSTRSGNRLMCRLPDGTSVTISRTAEALTIDHVIETLSQVSTKAKRLRSKNLPLEQLPALLKAAKDKSEEPPSADGTST